MAVDTLRLYNKYRPSRFDDVVGQSHVKQVLHGIVKKAHYDRYREYIFHSVVGGVSKTTFAKIFANAIVCQHSTEDGEPCLECSDCKRFLDGNHPDVIELNGADYNTVESIRKVKDIADQYPINPNGYRVIIIDEFQRLSSAAQSEFLSMLEFGRNRTVFIFTTTEIGSVLQPIRTRCFEFEVYSLTVSEVVSYLRFVCESEGYQFDESVLNKIAVYSNGSMREAVKSLSVVYETYGSVCQFNMPVRYLDILNLFVYGLLGKFEDIDRTLLTMRDFDVYLDVSRVLMDLSLWGVSNPRFLEVEDIKSVWNFLENDVARIVREFLILKPSTLDDLRLFLFSLFKSGVKSGGVSVGLKNAGRTFRDSGVKKESVSIGSNLLANGFTKV